MKIGLIGNMNNMNFAIMRYFRDLGADAHLLLNQEDGNGISKHFDVSRDTWNLDQWAPYIHRSNLCDVPHAAFNFIQSNILYGYSLFNNINSRNVFIPKPTLNRKIIDVVSGYDILMGSGISPAMLHRVGRRLDIFYPYSMGIEYLDTPWILSKLESDNFFARSMINKVRLRQLDGIKMARNVINFENGHTYDTLKKYNIDHIRIPIPMVYNREVVPAGYSNEKLEKTISRIQKSSFKILSHARLMWCRPNSISNENWRLQNKNNDAFIYAFKNLIDSQKEKSPLLILIEYGKDVDQTKKLIHSLGIDQYVEWLPVLDRKDIMLLLSMVDVCSGEFYELPGIIFGGTGWESLAVGTPFINGFNFSDGEFENIYNIPRPPILAACNEREITRVLFEVSENSILLSDIRVQSKRWFDENCGILLAKKWLEIALSSKNSRFN